MGAETAERKLGLFSHVLHTASHVAKGVDNGVELVDDEVESDNPNKYQMKTSKEAEVSLPLRTQDPSDGGFSILVPFSAVEDVDAAGDEGDDCREEEDESAADDAGLEEHDG